MNLKDIQWSKKTYQDFIEHLYNQVDEPYKTFNSGLLNTNKRVIGNRIPLLRSCAKEIRKGDYQSFLKLCTHNTYEEITIHGLLIGYLKLDIDNTIILLNDFVKYIDNWATNDVCASNLKIFKKETDKGYVYINKLLKTNDPWYIRFALILLLCHYINDDYIDSIIDISKSIKVDHYYVKMAVAWLLSMCYVKYPKKTLVLIKNKELDKWTHNKAIQKIRESLQIDDNTKEMLKAYKQ